MTTSDDAPEPTAKQKRGGLPALIDTDVHEMMASKRDLAPYLTGHWRTVVDTYNFDQSPLAPSMGWPVLPPSVASREEWQLSGSGSMYERMGSDVDRLREHVFDGEGVTAAILNGLFYPATYPSNFEFAQAMATAYNQWQIEQWIDTDERIYGSVHVVTDDPEAAAKDIRRFAEHPRIVQVLLPNVPDRQYGDPRYRPIFLAAAECGLVVAMHQATSTVPALGIPRHFFEWHTLAAPQAAMAQLTSIIAGGVFDEIPDLKVVLLESGFTWLPWYLGRADENYKEFRSDIPWVRRLPSEHIRQSVRFSSQPMGDVTARELDVTRELIGFDDFLMFSTDYPHYDADSFLSSFGSRLDDPFTSRVAYGNAFDTYPKLAALSATTDGAAR